jgi:RND family efflux transporter MFP subunit
VSGQVESLAPRFKTGNVIAKGESLAYIDNTTYAQALTSAKATYEAAVVALEEERLQGEQAQDEWSRSGVEGEPASELVLRKPQLKAAQATVDDATQAVKMAQRDLAFTTITAPFDALVISRDISPGSFIQAGESVASLYSAGQAEIAVALSPRQWQQLPMVSLKTSQSSSLNWAVTLSDTTSDGNWQAVVSRVEFNEDEATRQRNAIVTVDMPLSQSKPLLFGSFVSAVIDGKMLNDVWKIPASAISQKNEVWYVKPNGNTLQKFTPTVLFQHDNFAFIEPLQDTQSARIVARPLNSYLVNTAVAPVVEGKTGGADHE